MNQENDKPRTEIRIFIPLLVISILMCIAMIVVLIFQMNILSKVKELRHPNQEVLNILSGIDDLKKPNQEILNILSGIDDLKKPNQEILNILSGIDDLKKPNQELLKRMAEALKTKVQDWLDGHLSRMNLLEEERAEKAFNLAKKYFDANDIQMGRVYLLNAINHNPLDINQILFLSELPKKYPGDWNLLNETRSVLEMSLFKVEPDDVNQIVTQLNYLDTLEEQIYSNPEPVFDLKKTQNEFDGLKKIFEKNLFKSDSRIGKLKESILKLEELSAGLAASDNQDALFREVSETIEQAQESYLISSFMLRADNLISLIDNSNLAGNNLELEIAQSRYITASAIMASLYEFDFNSEFNKSFKNELANLHSRLIKSKNTIREVQSRQHYFDVSHLIKVALDKKMEHANNSGPKLNIEGPLEKDIATLQKSISDVNFLLNKITYDEYVERVSEQLKKVLNKIQELRQRQLVLYLHWASNRLRNLYVYAMDKDGAWTLWEDKEADEAMNKYRMYEIDTRLLTPEISEVYHELKTKIVTEPKAATSLKYQLKFMNGAKMKLEQF